MWRGYCQWGRQFPTYKLDNLFEKFCNLQLNQSSDPHYLIWPSSTCERLRDFCLGIPYILESITAPDGELSERSTLACGVSLDQTEKDVLNTRNWSVKTVINRSRMRWRNDPSTALCFTAPTTASHLSRGYLLEVALTKAKFSSATSKFYLISSQSDTSESMSLIKTHITEKVKSQLVHTRQISQWKYILSSSARSASARCNQSFLWDLNPMLHRPHRARRQSQLSLLQNANKKYLYLHEKKPW